MRNNTKLLFIIISIIFSFVKGDVDNIKAFTSLAATNANNYLLPLGTVLGTNMNNGYFRKATPHKLFGFDITFDASFTLAPSDQTTYDFYIPTDSVGFSFPFQFPKNLLALPGTDLYNNIPYEGNENLYKDREIDFGLSLQDILRKNNDDLFQNFFGDTISSTIGVSLDKAIPAIFDQVIEESWDLAKDIPGIGTDYSLSYTVGGFTIDTTLSPLYENETHFKSEFGDTIRSLIVVGLSDPDMIEAAEIPVPGGALAHLKSLLATTLPVANLIPNGLPLGTAQASIGLPFHTELTIRGLPNKICLSHEDDPESDFFGECNFSTQFGGFGGKIGISDYLTDILYKSENEMRQSESKDLEYIIDSQPSDIKPENVSKAISYLHLHEVDAHEIDSLNYLFEQGNTTVVTEIQTRMRDAQLQLESMPKSKKKKKKKKKKFPIDLSLGYYRNDIRLNFLNKLGEEDGLESINSIMLIQVGKNFNFPWIAFLGGIGVYGGVGFEKSSLSVKYVFINNFTDGCFSVSKDPSTYEQKDGQGIDYTESSCTGHWESGVPQSIELDLPGENKFRSMIGARIRVLFLDVFMDKNFGEAESYNLGIGLTIR